jgi:hypothetical protein
MAIYLYQYTIEGGSTHFELLGEAQLAGANAIFHIWQQKGEPRNQGWHINSNDLSNHFKDKVPAGSCPTVVIDYDPRGKEEIVLLQILDIYPYTYANKNTGEVWWSPMMLRMKKIFGKQPSAPINVDERHGLIAKFDLYDFDEEIVEFLYVQGKKGGWNSGMVGRVNAALIPPEARMYFRKYF